MPRGQRKGEFKAKDKRKLPIFIQSELDDYGLTCPEFRVYARIARRAGSDSTHSESIPNMATAFDVSEATIRRSLQILCLCNLISEKKRPGWTSEYTLNDKVEWGDKADLPAIRHAVLHPKEDRVTPRTTDRGITRGIPSHQTQGSGRTTDSTPLALETDEGTPDKVLPECTPDQTPRARAVGLEKPVRLKSPEEIAEEESKTEERQQLIDFLQARNPMPHQKVKAQESAIEFMFGTGRSNEQMIRCYEYLKTETWRTTAVTWQTVQTEIAGWVERGEPLKFEKNGNGKHGESKNLRILRGRYGAGAIPGRAGLNHRPVTAGAIPASTGGRGTGSDDRGMG